MRRTTLVALVAGAASLPFQRDRDDARMLPREELNYDVIDAKMHAREGEMNHEADSGALERVVVAPQQHAKKLRGKALHAAEVAIREEAQLKIEAFKVEVEAEAENEQQELLREVELYNPDEHEEPKAKPFKKAKSLREKAASSIIPMIQVHGLLSTKLYKFYSSDETCPAQSHKYADYGGCREETEYGITRAYPKSCNKDWGCEFHTADDADLGCCKQWVSVCMSGAAKGFVRGSWGALSGSSCTPKEDVSAEYDPKLPGFVTGGKECRSGRFSRFVDLFDREAKVDCKAKVDLKSPDLGSTEPFENIFGVPGSAGDVFGTFNDNLRDVGYENGKTLFGAAYDFRRVSEHYMNTEYGPKLKTLIEKVYQMNRNKKVLLLGHSMGTAVITLFLNSGESLGFDQAWKDKYIHAFHMVAPANGGAPMALMGVTAGISPTAACDGSTDSYWTFGWKIGLIQLLPNPRAYGDRKTWQASAAEGAESHTASTQGELLDSGLKRAAYKDVGLPLHKKFLDDPGVKTILYYNSGLPTPNTIDASTGKLGCDGFGDGTVPTHASTYMQEHWGDVTSVDYKNTCGILCKHREMMQSECLFEDVIEINHGLAHGKTPKFAANNVCSYKDGTPCGLGQKSCSKCRNPATIWHGYGKMTGYRCGTQPCWEKGHKCVPFTSCQTCCNSWDYSPRLLNPLHAVCK